MGKGDKRSFRGKITIGSHGNTRPKKQKTVHATPAGKPETKPEKKKKTTAAAKELTTTKKKTTTKKVKEKPKEE